MLCFGANLIRRVSESHSLCTSSNVLLNILAKSILYLNTSNAHLHPANLVLTDLLNTERLILASHFRFDKPANLHLRDH